MTREKRKDWTPDATLSKLVGEGHSWSFILPKLPGRKLADIQRRWRHLNEKLVKGERSEWSSEEDLVLVYLVGLMKNKLMKIAKIYPRTSRDLSNRWYHVLQHKVNNIKNANEKQMENSDEVFAQALLELKASASTPADSQQDVALFTRDEDLALCHYFGAHDDWNTISAFFPHRKEKELKDRWNNVLKDTVFLNKEKLEENTENLKKLAKERNVEELAKEGAAILSDAARG